MISPFLFDPHWWHFIPFIIGYSVSTQKGGHGAQDRLAAIAQALSDRAGAIFRIGKPIIQESSAQQLEALRTGGVGAKIPLIQRSVEASKQATGTALAATKDELSAAGIGGTPFAQNILARSRMGGEQAASQIPTAIAERIASGVPSGLEQIRASLGLGSAAAHSSLYLGFPPSRYPNAFLRLPFSQQSALLSQTRSLPWPRSRGRPFRLSQRATSKLMYR